MLLRTDPFRDLDRFAQMSMGSANRWSAMPFDAYRLGDEVVLEIDLPGVDAGSIDLTVERNVLTVHAERRRPAGDATELLIGERPFGTFRRQLFLGDALDTGRITAKYHDGVLVVSLPVAERAKPRKVEIATGAAQAVEVGEVEAKPQLETAG